MNSDLIPRIVLGTSAFGRQIGVEEASEVLGAAVGSGVFWVDTAPVYGSGFATGDCRHAESAAESVLGRVLAERRLSNVKVCTKVGVRNHVFGTALDNLVPGSPPFIRASLLQSIRRLGISRVARVQQHWPTPEVPLAETIDGLRAVVAEGLAEGFAFCNFTEAEMKRLAPLLNPHEGASVQIESSLVKPQSFCSSRFHTIGYFALHHGILTDRFLAKGVAQGSRLQRFPRAISRTSTELAHELGVLARSEGVAVESLAIRAVLEFGTNSVVIGATQPWQIRPQVFGETVPISREGLATLEALWLRKGRYRHIDPARH